ncbi:MAG: hypothetical protein Q9218_005104 [Villophora microphyllina]
MEYRRLDARHNLNTFKPWSASSDTCWKVPGDLLDRKNPRKKISVKEANNPRTTAITESNAGHSPLLKLPFEIRKEIFTHQLPLHKVRIIVGDNEEIYGPQHLLIPFALRHRYATLFPPHHVWPEGHIDSMVRFTWTEKRKLACHLEACVMRKNKNSEDVRPEVAKKLEVERLARALLKIETQPVVQKHAWLHGSCCPNHGDDGMTGNNGRE